jgi:hypothetical protein
MQCCHLQFVCLQYSQYGIIFSQKEHLVRGKNDSGRKTKESLQ